jgi:GNAT superfamily N-acetyltransferase
LKIRIATPQDATAISSLIFSVANYFTLHPQGVGAEAFFETISESAIASYISDPNFVYLTGSVDGNLVGVVAVRGNTHLYHLFVSPVFQRRGLARELWNTAMANAMQRGNPGEFTVNSTPHAVPVYATFGFEATGPIVETKGIAFVPMRYRRSSLVDRFEG